MKQGLTESFIQCEGCDEGETQGGAKCENCNGQGYLVDPDSDFFRWFVSSDLPRP